MKVENSLSNSNAKTKTIKERKFDKKSLYPVLTFFVSSFVFIFLLLIVQIAPFGTKHLLSSDLKAQFAPYIVMFKNHVKTLDWSNLGSSFTYSTVMALGKNLMATFGYYMASPINWIIFLFKDSQIDFAIATIFALKLSLASAFMCLFLRKRMPDVKPFWIVALSVTYAFTSFSNYFIFLINWFDGYALLPLLLYFIEVYLESKKKTGIIITLVFLFFANLYMSYIVGVFSFFYLVARIIYISKFERKISLKESFGIIGKFILTAICCALLLGIYILPVGMDILNNRDIVSYSYKNDLISFKAVDFINQFFLGESGTFNETVSDNKPFVFISVFITLAAIIFFISKVIEKKKKIYFGVVLLLMFVSLFLKPLDIAWQAFDTPNWFSHRFSFVLYPILYIIALEVVKNIKEISKKEILYGTVGIIVLLLINQSFGDMAEDDVRFVFNLGLIVSYVLLLLGIKKEKWHEQLKNMSKISAGVFVVIIILETSCFANLISSNLSSYSRSGDSDRLHDEIENLQLFTKESDPNTFYRLGFEFDTKVSPDEEKEYQLIYAGETSGYGNFNGISTFDSSSNKKIGRFLKQLGYYVSWNYFTYEYNYIAAPTDSFLSMPAIVTQDDDYSGELMAENTIGDSTLYVYSNEDYLPLAFAADEGAMNFDFYQLEITKADKNYFKFQNAWYKSMFPNEFTEDFYSFHKVTDENITEVVNGTKIDADSPRLNISLSDSYDEIAKEKQEGLVNKNAYGRNSEAMPIFINMSYVVEHSGEQYFCITADKYLSETIVYVGDEEICFMDGSCYFSRILRLGYYEEGDVIEIKVASNSDIFSYRECYFGYLDEAKFYEQLSNVDRSKVNVDKYSRGQVEFTTNFNENDILLTTIPYEKGWTCYVDGVETEITPYQDALIAVDCGPGSHKVELKFLAPGVKPGAIVSLIGVVAVAALIVLDVMNKKKK